MGSNESTKHFLIDLESGLCLRPNLAKLVSEKSLSIDFNDISSIQASSAGSVVYLSRLSWDITSTPASGEETASASHRRLCGLCRQRQCCRCRNG